MPNLSDKELVELKKNLKEYRVFYTSIAERVPCTDRYVKAVLSTKDPRYSAKVIQTAKLMLSEASNKEFSSAAKKYRKALTVI